MTLARPTRTELVAPDAEEDLRRLVAGWLLGYPSLHTRRAYGRDLDGFVRWCTELGVDLLAASRVHIDAWARHLAEVDGRAAATVARKLAAVTAFYRYLVLEEVLVANPGVHARRPRLDADHSSTLGLDRAAARGLLTAASEHSPRLHLLVALLLLNGLRIAEALALDVDDVTDYDRGHRVARLHRKGGRAARAALPPAVAAAVDTYLNQRGELDRERPSAGPLLVTRSGSRWRPSNAARSLAALAAHTEIPGAARVTPHVLRHAAITLALDAGATLRDVQDFAGHADPRTTRRYDHARGRLDRHASYTLAGHLS